MISGLRGRYPIYEPVVRWGQIGLVCVCVLSILNLLGRWQPLTLNLLCLQRLAKRWIAAHLFSASLAEEAIELLAAYLFLKPLPFSAPCSRIAGFLRFSFVFLCYKAFCLFLIIYIACWDVLTRVDSFLVIW